QINMLEQFEYNRSTNYYVKLLNVKEPGTTL
ncbi:hypothetical protein MHK_004816, partial [Candidatus Magnetomorum sp. HK-1]